MGVREILVGSIALGALALAPVSSVQAQTTLKSCYACTSNQTGGSSCGAGTAKLGRTQCVLVYYENGDVLCGLQGQQCGILPRVLNQAYTFAPFKLAVSTSSVTGPTRRSLTPTPCGAAEYLAAHPWAARMWGARREVAQTTASVTSSSRG